MEWIQNAIRDGEAELETLDVQRSDLVNAIATLRALVPASAGTAKKPLRNERTNERTNEARRGPVASAEPP